MASYLTQAANLVFGSLSAATEYARGWGRNIQWVSMKEGQRLAREQNKPAMVVIHKTWCRACRALRPRFANSRDIEKLSNEFIMINVEDDEEPKTSEFKPDGGYIPRILFMDPYGNVLQEVRNEGSTRWKYFYGETGSILDSMKRVLKQTGGNPNVLETVRPRSTSRGRR
ncbi:thioredoxin domain-containing protein 12 isoform X2 [Aplysia californica]|uniref:Thioredoxin domain-containing protein 12 isoform X2 n=1 Tax=Aplysia californica TaxID=6500 RepID=A0ABM0JU29_APLCA|nr:thioredoxin domain-containing protein 12 isoform X2 [Aplysia californica]